MVMFGRCCHWSFDSKHLVTSKNLNFQPQKEYERRVAYVPELIWSSGLESFMIVLYIRVNVTFL